MRTPPKVPRPAPAPVAGSALVADLEVRLHDAADRSAVLADFWAGPARATPVVEPAAPGQGVVTFLLRDDDAEQVLLFVNRLTDERDLGASLMRRVEGTDVWHLSYRMDDDWRASYAFLVQRPGERAPWLDAADQVAIRATLDRGRCDPRNPDRCRNRAGVEQSVASLPGAPDQPWLARRTGVPRGDVRRTTTPDGRTAWLYRSVGVRQDAPLLIALDGEVWTGPQDLPTTLDNLVHDSATRPLCALLLDSGGRDRRWDDLGEGSSMPDLVAGPLLEWARDVLPVSRSRDDVTVAGQSLGALTALWTLVTHPDRVGSVISQSASLWQDEILGVVPRADLTGTRAWVEVGRQEWVLQPRHPRAADLLRAAGSDVRYDEFNGGHDYACWRGGIATALAALHPVV